MAINNQLAGWMDEMTGWRQHLHAHPEIALQETQTSDFVAQKLESWGLEVHRGLAETGVIGTLRGTQTATERSRFALIWMRCRWKRTTPSHIAQPMLERCMG